VLASRQILWTLVALANAALSAGCQREPGLVDRINAASSQRQSALAGTFSGERPVHPEGFVEETLTLNEDGTFSLTTHDPASKGNKAGDVIEGMWTLELAGARIRLRPKTGEDMLFAISSNDVLIPLDADGNSTDSKSMGLHRVKPGS
jgi:hypothetical protein